MVITEDLDTRSAEGDGDVNMIDDNEQGVEEPPPRLMITKMVSYVLLNTLYANMTQVLQVIAHRHHCAFFYALIYT